MAKRTPGGYGPGFEPRHPMKRGRPPGPGGYDAPYPPRGRGRPFPRGGPRPSFHDDGYHDAPRYPPPRGMPRGRGPVPRGAGAPRSRLPPRGGAFRGGPRGRPAGRPGFQEDYEYEGAYGYDKSGYGQSGYDQSGYNEQPGYNNEQSGYDPYNALDYDESGYDANYYHSGPPGPRPHGPPGPRPYGHPGPRLHGHPGPRPHGPLQVPAQKPDPPAEPPIDEDEGSDMEIEDDTANVAGVLGVRKKLPIKYLKSLYPDATFTSTVTIATSLGHCLGYEVVVEGKTFYGEGTSSKIAKGLAALDALHHFKPEEVDNLVPVCNLFTEMKKCQEIKELHEKPKEPKENAYAKKFLFKRQDIPSEVKVNPEAHAPANLQNFKLLKRQYVGRDNEGDLIETFTPNKGRKTCVLIVQGHVFRGDGENELVARDNAAKEALVFFEKTPPTFVAASQPKLQRMPVYDRSDPTDYTNMLFCKAWKFACQLTQDVVPCYAKKQNLAFVLKVYGHTKNIDKVEVVAVGCGAKVINKEYMSSNGFVINDCGGEALCIRAFRRYLVDQLINLMKGKESVFRKNPFGRIMMKEGYTFLFLTNASPMGDCKVFDKQFHNILQSKTIFDATKEDTSLSVGVIPKKKHAGVTFDGKDCGKLTRYRKMVLDHVPDQCMVPNEETAAILHTTASPSDKLAVRNVCGIQGALLSTIIDAIFIPDVYVGRAFDQTAMERGLFGRLMGGNYPEGVGVKIPQIHQIKWKPSRMADKTTIYSFLWCQGQHLNVIRADIGSVIDLIKPADVSNISEEMMRAYDSREIKSASPSQYCTYNYYLKFTELLQLMQKPVDTYVKLKKSATWYQSAKQAAYATFITKNLGAWPIKSIKPNY